MSVVFIGQDDAVPSWLDGSSPTVSEPLRDREECRTAHTLADCAPFLQIRYRGTPELPDEATIAFEWKGEGDADFSPERRIEISAHHPDPWERASKLQHCLVEAWKHPGWKGKISAFRFIFPPGAAVQARKIAESDFALATTGIAGPGGGSEAKPVATVFIALADKEGVKVCRYFYPTDREAFKFLVTQTALNLLRERLLQIEED